MVITFSDSTFASYSAIRFDSIFPVPSGSHSSHVEILQLPGRVRGVPALAMPPHGSLFPRPAGPAGSQEHAVPIARHDLRSKGAPPTQFFFWGTKHMAKATCFEGIKVRSDKMSK